LKEKDMATLKVIDNTCEHPEGCASAATREVFDGAEKSLGRYCTRHAQKVLIEASKGEKRRPQAVRS